MTPEQHLAKGARIMRGLDKFVFPDDYLAIVDAAVTAGYHFGNALLHRHGVCGETDHFNTPSKLPKPIAALPAAIQPAFQAFAELERLRFDYVRSPSSFNAELQTSVRKHLDILERASRNSK